MPIKKAKNPEEEFNTFLKAANHSISKMERKADKILVSCNKILFRANKLCAENQKAIKTILKSFEQHKIFLEKMANLTENIDETLGNVLLAIRQNEYLQAYYPAQQGFTEGKVVLKHPAKLGAKQ